MKGLGLADQGESWLGHEFCTDGTSCISVSTETCMCLWQRDSDSGVGIGTGIRLSDITPISITQ